VEATTQSCLRLFGKGHEYLAGWLPLLDRAAREEFTYDPDYPSVHYGEEGPLFRLARIIKGRVIAEGRNTGASAFLPMVHVFCRLFVRHSDGVEPWAFSCNEEIDWEDDQEIAEAWDLVWDKVRYGEGEDLLTRAWRMAQAKNLLTPETLSEKAKKILRLAYELQEQNPGQPIILPQERMAAVLGMQQPDVSQKLETLRKKGFLKLAAPHDRLGKKAAEYYCAWTPKRSARSKLK